MTSIAEPVTTPTAHSAMYAVRFTAHGATEPTIAWVGNQNEQATVIRDLAGRGVAAEPLTAPVPNWQVDHEAQRRIAADIAREQVLAIAQRHWEGETSLNEVLDEIAPYSQLAFPERTLRLGELISELAYEELVEDDRVQPGPGEDRQSLREAAERMVREAVDALIGPAPSSPGCLPPAAEATTGGNES